MRVALLRSSFVVGLLCLSACQAPTSTEINPEATPSPTISDSQLTLANATLEQADATGQTLWRVQAETTTYTPDRQTANLETISGQLFQDGVAIFNLTADQGEIKKDGETIHLQENVVVTDIRNGAVLKAKELLWYPQQDLLLIKNNLQGTHPQLQITAQIGRYYSRSQKLEVEGEVRANSLDPPLQLEAENATWHIEQEIIRTDTLKEVVRFNEQQIITDRLVAKSLEIHLQEQQIKVEGNAELRSLEPPIQIASNLVIWNYEKGQIVTNEPIKIIDRESEVTITANQAEVDLVQEIAYLEGGVKGESPRHQGKLSSQQLTWYIPTGIVEASGQVIYEQVDPFLYLTGVRAKGRLEDNSVVVEGDERVPVVTEVIPE